jgi:signal transduction histidine kinase
MMPSDKTASRLGRFWFRAGVQTKFLLIIVPLTIALTVFGHAWRQTNAGNRVIDSAVRQFDEVGRRSAEALAHEFWNYNVTQAGAIVQSLMLIPNVVSVSSVQFVQGNPVPDGPFNLNHQNPALAGGDEADLRTVQFPIRMDTPSAPAETVGELRITYSLSSLVAENRSVLIRALLSSLPSALLLVLGITFALNRAILRPIEEVSASARQSDEAFVPIQLHSGDQLGTLVSSFNDLRARHIVSTRQLQDARDEAVQANAAKSAFLAMMSHELRTPLNAVIGYSEMLQEELAEEGASASTLEDLGRIRSAGRHLLELINSVLDLSKIEAGKIELDMGEVSVPQLVDYATSTVQPLIAAGGNQLMVQMPPDIGLIISDATRLRQVLLNLLSNAAKFTHGGTITLAVRRDTSAGQGEQMVFDIQDTGIGMTPEQVDKLFQAFVQADSATTRKYGGTGLGLVISRRLCNLMGGDVTVTSVPGAGSCFTARVAANPPSPSKA